MLADQSGDSGLTRSVTSNVLARTKLLQIRMDLTADGKRSGLDGRFHSRQLFDRQGTSPFRATILGMLTRNKKLNLVFKCPDGDRNKAVSLAAIWTIMLFANKTVDRHRFYGLVVLRIKAMRVSKD
jgi:hypothetical protein